MNDSTARPRWVCPRGSRSAFSVSLSSLTWLAFLFVSPHLLPGPGGKCLGKLGVPLGAILPPPLQRVLFENIGSWEQWCW
jgi:hypothetical protein